MTVVELREAALSTPSQAASRRHEDEPSPGAGLIGSGSRERGLHDKPRFLH